MIGCKLSKTGQFKVGYGNAEIRQPLLFSMLNRQVVNKRAATHWSLIPPDFRPRWPRQCGEVVSEGCPVVLSRLLVEFDFGLIGFD